MHELTLTDTQMILIGQALMAMPDYPLGYWEDEFKKDRWVKVFEGPKHREMCLSLAPGIHRRLNGRYQAGKNQYPLKFPTHELSVINQALRWYDAGTKSIDQSIILQSVQPKLLAC